MRAPNFLGGSETILSGVLYDPFGPVRGWTWGNASQTARSFDLDGNLDLLDSGGLRTYAQDDAFRITGITDAVDPGKSWSYGYDLLDRLTGASRAGLSQGWTYDGNGNRLGQTGAAASSYAMSGSSNRLNGVSGALARSYGYDAAGNAIADGTASFGYDGAGRLTSASKSGTSAGYAHNALGQRVRKTVNGATTIFTYDESGHLLGEYEASGALIREYVWLGDIPVAVITGGPGTPPYVFWYIHADHLNTPRSVENPTTGELVWRWDSAPFGETAPDEDPDGDLNPFTLPLRFPGQYADAETGLHYNYFRDYEPQTGRYVQSDPIGLEGGINTYGIALSNPLSNFDLLGLEVLSCARRADFGFGIHGYFWDTRTGRACGARGSGFYGGAEESPEAGPARDPCAPIPASAGHEDELMECCFKAGKGFFDFWIPPFNDCQSRERRCIRRAGLLAPGIPSQRFGDPGAIRIPRPATKYSTRFLAR